jgi:hypothetical protein
MARSNKPQPEKRPQAASRSGGGSAEQSTRSAGSVPVGAHIKQTYLVRHQEVIAVNRRDLKDILDTDLLASGLSGVGLFFLSGALWLGVDRMIDQTEFTLTPAIYAFLVISLSGLALLIAGGILALKKRGKISDIFDETEELKPIGQVSSDPTALVPSRLSPLGIEQKTQQ